MLRSHVCMCARSCQQRPTPIPREREQIGGGCRDSMNSPTYIFTFLREQQPAGRFRKQAKHGFKKLLRDGLTPTTEVFVTLRKLLRSYPVRRSIPDKKHKNASAEGHLS